MVTVEDAQLAMELASQIRTKATEAAQNIFQHAGLIDAARPSSPPGSPPADG